MVGTVTHINMLVSKLVTPVSATPLLRVMTCPFEGISSLPDPLLRCNTKTDLSSDVESVQEGARSLACPFPVQLVILQPPWFVSDSCFRDGNIKYPICDCVICVRLLGGKDSPLNSPVSMMFEYTFVGAPSQAPAGFSWIGTRS